MHPQCVISTGNCVSLCILVTNRTYHNDTPVNALIIGFSMLLLMSLSSENAAADSRVCVTQSKRRSLFTAPPMQNRLHGNLSESYLSVEDRASLISLSLALSPNIVGPAAT